MSSDDVKIVVVLLAGGFGMIVTAFLVKKGYQKWWFLSEPTPTVPKDIVYGLLPLGIGFMLTGLGLMVNSKQLGMVGLFGGGLLTFVFMAWKPDWVKPNWLLWLEANYDIPTVEFMLDQARQNRQDHSWSKRMNTPKDRKAWAGEMARKYELEFERRRTK